jgi:phosphoglycolate phosphatase-like HAD superfamily hydrolase
MIFRSVEMYNKLRSLTVQLSEVAVAGDTESDMKAGVSAGVPVILGVTSGAHSAEELRLAGATEVSSTVLTLLKLI